FIASRRRQRNNPFSATQPALCTPVIAALRVSEEKMLFLIIVTYLIQRVSLPQQDLKLPQQLLPGTVEQFTERGGKKYKFSQLWVSFFLLCHPVQNNTAITIGKTPDFIHNAV